MKEAQTMRQLHHPNVLTLHVSFVSKQSLWMVEPYVAGGSMLNIMKYAYREVRSPRDPRKWILHPAHNSLNDCQEAYAAHAVHSPVH